MEDEFLCFLIEVGGQKDSVVVLYLLQFYLLYNSSIRYLKGVKIKEKIKVNPLNGWPNGPPLFSGYTSLNNNVPLCKADNTGTCDEMQSFLKLH